MKNLNNKQIEQVKSITIYASTKFHGNAKRVGDLSVNDFKKIVYKKTSRQILKMDKYKKTNIQKVRELINWSLKCKGTNYFKIMIEGNSGIYYANPAYNHGDYNKIRLFDKNEETIKLMVIFNSIVNK